MNDNAKTGPIERDIDRQERLRILDQRLDYRPVEERIKDFDEACLGFTPETARLEASRCIQCPSDQACILACPLHNDIPAAMWEISEGNFSRAAAIFRETSNFPEVCGRLCPDELLCAGSCGVGKFNPAIRFGRLEAFVTDYQRQTEGLPALKALPPSGRRVAIIGSGPAGLAVAEELARLGHEISVFEVQPRPGGTLLYAVPRFRLPAAIVEDKVAQLERLGVEFLLETRLGGDVTLDELFRQGYHAVFLGTGAGPEAVTDLPGADLKGVYQATEFLTRTNLDRAYLPADVEPLTEVGERVAVFGGGHAAVDSARTAVRLGAREVTCYFHGSERAMQCRLEDKSAAQGEHIRFVALTEPIVLIGDRTGHVAQVLCQRMRLDGRDLRAPLIPVEGSKYIIDTDLVVLAPERGPDPWTAEAAPGMMVDREGWIIIDRGTGHTTRSGVFAAGDNTGGAHLAVLAIEEGRRVAAGIRRYLRTLD